MGRFGLLGGFFFGFGFLLFGLGLLFELFFGSVLSTVELVHSFDDDEDGESDDEEVDDVLDEVAVSDVGDGVGAEDIRNVDREGGEIKTAGQEAGDGHDDVVDKGFDDGGESATNRDADGEIHDATAVDELFKFADK